PGFIVSGTCGSFEEAIRLTSKHTYDLLLVDVNIQGKSGLDLIRALRKRDYPAELIMITAAGEQEAIRIGLQCGSVRLHPQAVPVQTLRKEHRSFRAAPGAAAFPQSGHTKTIGPAPLAG
ncbi:MAG TPA: response regulator, partial [Trichococcus flocculiformis]|nr:response regulator [Trichococcus flocculiformis]